MRRLFVSALLGALVLTACTGEATPEASPLSSVSTSPTASAPEVSADALAFCTRFDEVIGVNALSETLGEAESATAAAEALRSKIDEIREVTADAPDEILEDLQTINEASSLTVLALADLLEGEHGEVLWPYFKENRSPSSIEDDASEAEVAARDAAEQWSENSQFAYPEPVLQAGERVGVWYQTTCASA